jgi:hypothetical protein
MDMDLERGLGASTCFDASQLPKSRHLSFTLRAFKLASNPIRKIAMTPWRCGALEWRQRTRIAIDCSTPEWRLGSCRDERTESISGPQYLSKRNYFVDSEFFRVVPQERTLGNVEITPNKLGPSLADRVGYRVC